MSREHSEPPPPADEPGAGWEPGAPSVRAMAPSVVGGAVVPLTVYYLVRRHVSSDAEALMIAGVFPAGWVAIEWARRRRLDPIGAITLFGFLAGALISVLLGGNAFVLKVRDSAFTALFGVTCLASLAARRPMMFHLGKALSAGHDERRRRAYDELYELPTVPRVFAIITVCWGVGLILEGAARVLLALVLPTGPFLAVSPVLGFAVFGGLFLFTVLYSRRARRLGEEQLATEGLVYPSVGDIGAVRT